MDNLRASVLRPQLQKLDQQCRRWNARYKILEQELNSSPWLVCPTRDPKEGYVGSSIQFRIPKASSRLIQDFVTETQMRGVYLSWYGRREPVGFTSTYTSWEYLGERPNLANTQRILATTCDMRIPLTFSTDDCLLIAEIIRDEANRIFS